LRPSALAAYEQLCAEQGDWPRLEQQYRKLIHHSGEQDRELRCRLWQRLGDCYRDRFADRERARIAYEACTRLAPDEVTVWQALAGITLDDPARGREAAQALRATFLLRPIDPAPAHLLFALYERDQRHSAQVIVAQALALQ